MRGNNPAYLDLCMAVENEIDDAMAKGLDFWDCIIALNSAYSIVASDQEDFSLPNQVSEKIFPEIYNTNVFPHQAICAELSLSDSDDSQCTYSAALDDYIYIDVEYSVNDQRNTILKFYNRYDMMALGRWLVFLSETLPEPPGAASKQDQSGP